jgi:uncharacterized protein YndB with AHSA1/START domain
MPERLIRWWAPKGFTTPFCKIDLRPGGILHYCMRSSEGLDIWGIGVYREIGEHEGQTKVTLCRSIAASVEEREATRQGWSEMLDRLAEDLTHPSGGTQ